MAETLTPYINTLLLAPDTVPLIKKKAALSLLRLHRKYPLLTTPDQWLEKMEHLLKENDLGLLSSVMALLLFLTRDEKATYVRFVPDVVNILIRIIVRKGMFISSSSSSISSFFQNSLHFVLKRL